MMRFISILFLLFVSGAMFHGQSFTHLQDNYSGDVSLEESTGTITFNTTGTIYFAEKVGSGNNPKIDQKQNFWDVPIEVSKIVIKSGVTVTGAFHTSATCTIEGEDRKTSVVYGTPLERWADKNNPGGQDLEEWYYAQFQNYGGALTVRNLTALNPYSYFMRGWNTVNHLSDCDFIDDRGGSGNHSDGFAGGHGSTVDGCYFETGDDAIKCYFDITVSNCTINMIQNCVPFQFGWSANGYQDSHSVLTNITILGESGRWPGNPVFQWKGGTDYKTVEMSGCEIVNLNGCLFDLEYASGTLDIDIANSYLKLKTYKEELLADGTRTICGTTEELNSYDCRTTAIQVPALIEAQDYTNMSGVLTEPTSDTSGVENITGIDEGDWLEYELDVLAGGEYTFDFRLASETEDIDFNLLVNQEQAASIHASPTGGGQTWTTVSTEVDLGFGMHTIRLEASGGGWKLNWVNIQKKAILPNVEALKVRVGGYKSMLISWTENIQDEAGFIIERRKLNDGLFQSIDTVGANEVLYNDTMAIEDFTLYAYRVRTLYAEGVSQATDLLLGRPPVKEFGGLPAPWYSISFSDTLGAMASNSGFEDEIYSMDVGDGDFWNSTDRGHFIYQTHTGDVEIIAQIIDYSHVQDYTMAGPMIRDSLDAGSKLAAMFMISDPGAIVRARFSDNGDVDQEINNTGEKAPYWLRLKRIGDQFTGYVSEDRIDWRQVREVSIPMRQEVYIGLAATSHTIDTTAKFTFSDVVVGTPLNEYTVSASASPNGSISPTGSILVLQSTSLDYQITPDQGYEIYKVEVDGDSVGIMDQYTFSDISDDHTIHAIFEKLVSTGPGTESLELNVYPNPTSGMLTIEQYYSSEGSISIYSADGRKMMNMPVLESMINLDVSDFQPGIYMLIWQGQDEVVSRQIVISNPH